ncbi:MAG: ABC transporter ATP-binding protein [Termitinemataceae bacterium]|nr:MAG: ABC transporter ATP-binding protein [Termitinemataceae bacterium]
MELKSRELKPKEFMKIGLIGDVVSKLRFLLSHKQKYYLIILFFLTLLLSIVETIGVSVIMPFITVASNPAVLEKGGRFNLIYDFLGFRDQHKFIIFFGICVIAFYFFRSLYNVFYTYIMNKFALGTYTYLAKKCYLKYLSIPYKVYVQKNSAELHQGIDQSNSVSSMLLCILNIASDLIIISMLYSFMLLVNLFMTISLTLMMAILILIIVKVIVKKNKKLGIISTEAGKQISKNVTESYGNFKIIKLKSCADYTFKRFEEATKKLSNTQVISSTLGAMPRGILESSGFSLLVVSVLFILINTGSVESIIPVIAMYAVSLYRILPAVNKIMGNISSVSYLHNSLNIVYDFICQESDGYGEEQISFNKNIKIENICFSYLTGKEILHDICFEIKKGEKVAVTGNSGGGKSTLADIIIGMHMPLGGTLYCDGVPITHANIKSYRSKIGYIPQLIYLFDDTVAANVVFGSEYNEKRLIEVLKMASIWDMLLEKNGLDTIVGEGGIQLSGGQKQRIGIARALYTDPEILVLDEATSALDNETEGEIMKAIYEAGRNKTLIILAHRLSTIENCDKRIVIDNGSASIYKE